MRLTTRIAALCLAALLQACVTAPVSAPEPVASAPAAVEAKEAVTILVGIDGFRPDYLDRGITPVLSRLASEGVRGAMRPVFPTKTFPNHYTLVTGLYPDHHGVVGNRMIDPARPDETFTMATLDRYWWDGGEPVWVAAEKAGIRSATMFWPGSNAPVMGVYPSDWQQFNQEVTGRQRVDAVIDWLRRPAATRPRFVTLYFDTVDTAGHRHGPESAETNAAIAQVDALIGRMVSDLETLGQSANIVVVADHGMAMVSPDRVIRLDQMIDPALFRAIEDGPYAALAATADNDAALAAALLKPHDHMKCWRKSDIPERLHYGTHPRVPPFLCLAEPGWLIVTREPEREIAGATHGWAPDMPEMRAVFIGSGPGFVAGRRIDDFDIIDIAPLLRQLIDLPPAAPSDGSAATFSDVVTGR